MDLKNIIKENPYVSQMLRNCPEFIMKKWEVKYYDANTIICEQEEIYDYFYVIIDGYANIYRTAPNGKTYSQCVYKKGDYFGELEVFDRRPYICTVEALTHCRVIRIHRQYFLQWIEEDKNFLLYIVKTVCNSFYNLSKKAGDDTLYSLKYRVCNYLIYCAEEGKSLKNGIRIEIDKKHLSEQFVVTQRSINRILKYLDEEGIISVSSKFILIKDINKLKYIEKMSKFE